MAGNSAGRKIDLYLESYRASLLVCNLRPKIGCKVLYVK